MEEFLPFPSGRLKRIYEVARRLARKHEVHIYCQRYHKNEERVIDGIYVHGIGLPINSPSSFLKRTFSAGSYFFSLIDGNSFDVINTNWLFPAIPSYLAAKLRKTPVILSSDGILWRHVSNLNLQQYGSAMTLFGCMMEDLIVRNNYEAYTTVSQGTKEELVSMGVNTEKVFVVYNGVDLDFYDKISVQEKNVPTVCYVGHLEERKNVLDLINAFSMVLKVVPDANLVVAGSGILREKAIGLVKALGMTRNVSFKGQLGFEEAATVIKSSDVLVLPSLIEGFGLVLAEANACRKPVIAYNVPNVREVVRDGINGFLVQPKNVKMLSERIIRILKDENLQKQLGENGRKIVEENFTWDKASENILKVYHHVLAENRNVIF